MLEIFKTYEGKSELVTIEDFERGAGSILLTLRG